MEIILEETQGNNILNKEYGAGNRGELEPNKNKEMQQPMEYHIMQRDYALWLS